MNETPLSERVQEVRDLVALLTPISDMALLLGVHGGRVRDGLEGVAARVAQA